MRLFLVLVLCISASAQSPKQHIADKQTAQAQIEKPTNNQGVSDSSKASETQFYTYNNQNPEGQETAKEVSDYLLALFTFALVVVSVMQWKVLREHEGWMRKHDTQLEKLAQSTRENADAIMASERAWVIASPKDPNPDFGFVPEAGNTIQQRLAGANKQNVFFFAFKNTGNTPARLTEIIIRYAKISRFEDIPEIPDLTGGARLSLNGLPLVRGDSIGYGAVLEPDPILSRSDFEAVFQRKAFLYAFGIAVYQDVYGKRHESKFGYLYRVPSGGDLGPREFRREGLPPLYNEAS